MAGLSVYVQLASYIMSSCFSPNLVSSSYKDGAGREY